MQRLIDENFNAYEWIHSVLSSILVNFMSIRIGCSFLCKNKDDELYYVYAAPSLAPYSIKTQSTMELERFIDAFKGVTCPELMNMSHKTDENVFEGSNVIPYKPVCLYIWMTK